MKILVIGGGGREHALVWKLAQSPHAQTLYCAPGNPGIAKHAQCVSVNADNISDLFRFAKEKQIDLTVVGPELPLALGLVDRFHAEGLSVVGPMQTSARLESSKVFAKAFMKRHNIPTAPACVFSDPGEAIHYIHEHGMPIVVKADGLAAGKGVTVCEETNDAIQAVEDAMCRKVFGAAGHQIILEDCLKGQETTFLVFTDGRTVKPMVTSQDHKRVFNGDQGPNTGGMGAYSPAPILDETLQSQVLREIVEPTINGLASEGCSFQGVLYVGLMLTSDGPQVLEFNARFGDPEAQVILPRLETDLVEVLHAIAEKQLDRVKIQWKPNVAVCVVQVSRGYPARSETGFPITGLAAAEEEAEVIVFHAGTMIKDGCLMTAGGRVLGVTGCGKNLNIARTKAYEAASKIRFEGIHYRHDIALKSLPISEEACS